MRIYYDKKELRDYLELLNPITNCKDFAIYEDSIIMMILNGVMGICFTLIMWFILPIALLIPIKLER